MTYQPELGQAVFGQPWKEHSGGELLDAALGHLDNELQRVLWNRLQKECPSPFHNTAARFETEGLAIHAYSWSEEDQPWNLKCGDLEISWYKWCGRGTSSNKPLTPDEIAAFLDDALAIIRSCDSPDYGEQDGRAFTYE
jgi:hypothetical protein